MAYFTFKEKEIYYEIHGEGIQTLMFLNGIMMSAASWQPFVGYLSKHYRLVLLDFFDQGKSAYLDGEVYDQDLQIAVVKATIEALGLERVLLVGISYGGEVAMKVAARHGELIDGLVLANTTAYTDPQLKAIGDSWKYAASTLDGNIFFKATIPPIYAGAFYEENIAWLTAREQMFADAFTEKWYKGFMRLVDSAATHNAVDELSKINCPVMIIGAADDQITPIARQRLIKSHIPSAKFVVITDCGHASMYEKPTEFIAIIDGFARSMHTTFTVL